MARKIILAITLELIVKVCFAQPCTITGLNFNHSGNSFQIAFDTPQKPHYKVYTLANPARLVIDFKEARTVTAMAQPPAGHPLFAKIRWAIKNNTDMRIVLDLKGSVTKVVTHAAAAQLAVTLNAEADDSKPIRAQHLTVAGKAPIRTIAMVSSKSSQPVVSAKNQDAALFVVAIDAGHGGKDSGAQGPGGTFEKKITFAIAKKLARLINRQAGMKAVMVRKGDYFVGLRERMDIARAANADLFISLHADAFHDAGVSGASVYTLSNSAASSEAARWLADKENGSELVGGIKLHDKKPSVRDILVDLSQTATQEASYHLANHILNNFQKVCVLHKDVVQKAGFIVLKSPDIPSILVETAFLSNPLEEQNLINSVYQDKMAAALFNGIRNYFKQARPIKNDQDQMVAL